MTRPVHPVATQSLSRGAVLDPRSNDGNGAGRFVTPSGAEVPDASLGGSMQSGQHELAMSEDFGRRDAPRGTGNHGLFDNIRGRIQGHAFGDDR